ncbi:MAG: Co2+/Mg2+ efflux protein ApaG [Nevskiaceae bacterium]|nr:MAG: Co2+/Mg2+ efflux protein ApaG [Nevskiaceae bacterium]TBR72505.1 MAG: Co2+/Mg2+ efflux protein ApaG [Nevskiaceae bacterium]
MSASDTATRGIRIIATPRYVPEHSAPARAQYLFVYDISIRNGGDVPVKLLSRHWVITDGEGRVEEVRGEGVVGHQPRLQPGQHFDYTSACPLPTPVGTMHGSFRMAVDGGEEFDATIQPFRLAVPGALN